MFSLKNTFSIIFIAICILSAVFLYNVLFLLLCAYLISSFLQPVINLLATKINYNLAKFFVFSIFCASFLTGIALIIPICYKQCEMFINNAPIYKLYLEQNFLPLLINKLQTIDSTIVEKILQIVEQAYNQVFLLSMHLLTNIWNYTIATIHMILFILLLPIFTFYIIKDQEILKQYLHKAQEMINPVALKFVTNCINIIFAFLKGQLIVCCVMACYYSAAFSAINLNFALFLGIISGISVAIPFLGILISCCLTSIITLFHFGISSQLIYMLIVYGLGITLEGYMITPKIIGDQIGISPVIIILALLICGNLFGIPGLLIAIPMVCVLKVALQTYASVVAK